MPVTAPNPSNALGCLMAQAWRHDGLTHSLAVLTIQGPMEPMGYVEPALLRAVIRERRAERQRLARRATVLMSRLSGMGMLQGASDTPYELADYSAEIAERGKDTHRARMIRALADGPLSRADLLWLAGGNDAPRPVDWKPSGYLNRAIAALEEDGTVSRGRKLTEEGRRLVESWPGVMPERRGLVLLFRGAA